MTAGSYIEVGKLHTVDGLFALAAIEEATLHLLECYGSPRGSEEDREGEASNFR